MNMVPVILCGGSGSRLWPLSRKVMPKQFIEFSGGSLFDRTLQRVASMGIDDCLLVCAKDYRFFVADAIANSDPQCRYATLLEPVARDTAPAIALAALYIREQFGDLPMLILPADHVIEDAAVFNQKVTVALPMAEAGKLVTFGITPDAPYTGYGYIRRGEPCGDDAFTVLEFQEKPNSDEAQRRVESGECYWNSGMFLFKAQVYLDLLATLAPEIFAACQEAYAKQADYEGFSCVNEAAFAASPKLSVDYAVMERAMDSAVVMPVDVGWSDVGSWDALGSLLEHDSQGNCSSGDVVLQNSSRNIVYANKRMVSLLGMNDCIVVETSDAILVANKSEEQAIKSLVNQLTEDKRTEATENLKMFRPWGSYEQVDVGENFQVKRIVVNPGESLSLQMHYRRAEHWVVVKGRARVTVGETIRFLEENQSVYIPKETKHRLENLDEQPLFLIEVQCGDYLGEDDIVRYEDIYGRSKEEADIAS